jgi:16S rRNA (guanine527-N7)-methyltransferase
MEYLERMADPLEEAMALLSVRAKQLHVNLTSEQVELLKQYCAQLAQYNDHTNLVSDASPEILVADHIVDSLTLVKFVDDFQRRKFPQEKVIRLVDIGSGAGLPGMILAMALPYLNVTLIDSVGKKVRFLESFITNAKLSARVRALPERAEIVAHQPQYREKFHVATARAVGGFELVAELAMPFLQVDGELYVQKSLSQLDEASRHATKSLPKLGGAIIEATALDARILGKERAVLVAEKRSTTEDQYPRAWAQMKHRPLSQ